MQTERYVEETRATQTRSKERQGDGGEDEWRQEWNVKEGSFKLRGNIRGGGREAERRTGTSRFPQEQQVNIIHWLPIMSSDKSSGGRRRVGMRTVSCVLYPDYINSRNEAGKKCEQISRGRQDRNLERQRESFPNLFISCIHPVKTTTAGGKGGGPWKATGRTFGLSHSSWPIRAFTATRPK